MLRLPRKLQLILRKRHKSILRVPHETTFDTLQNTSECHEVPRLPRNEATRRLKPPKMIPSAELTMGTAILLRTVADGCERLGNVERTHPQPPNPQSETGTLAMHSGKSAKVAKQIRRPKSPALARELSGSACLSHKDTPHIQDYYGLLNITPYSIDMHRRLH